MKGIKIGSVFAVCGFLLSFISGLFSHTSIISVLLKAILFAVIFGLLGFGISFVFSKFLSNDSSSEIGDDSSSEIKNSSGKQNSNGHFVDITIDDEDLEKGNSENHFVVNDNRQMLNKSDVKETAQPVVQKEPEQVSNDNSNGFVPLKNFETLKSLTGKEAVQPSETVASVQSNNSPSSKDDGLDVLPDMNNISFGENESSESSDDDDVETDFEPSTTIRRQNDEPTEIKDAALMAKAISSILSNEDS